DPSPGNLLLTHRSPASAEESSGAPDSALIRADERLVLADLGMCKDLALNSGVTVSGGTEGFRPPEQSGLGIVDIRADIWAMSALLAWLVRGSELPSALTKVLKRGMADRPKRRQANAQEWLKEVEEALAPPAPEVPSEPDAQASAVEADADAEARSVASAKRGRIVRRLQRALALAALVIALVGRVLLGLCAFQGSGTQRAHMASSPIDPAGPEAIEVGQAAVFTAETVGVNSWVWTLPSHRYVSDQGTVTN